MKFLDRDDFSKPANCIISAAVTRTAAARQKTATGGPPAAGRGGFHGTSAGAAAAAALCSPGTPDPANPPRCHSDVTRSFYSFLGPYINSCGQPATPRPTYCRPPPTRTAPPRRRCPSPLRLAPPLSAGTAGSQWFESTAAPPGLEQPLSARPAPHSPRVGRGAGALGARGAKKRRPRVGRGALRNFGGAESRNHP